MSINKKNKYLEKSLDNIYNDKDCESKSIRELIIQTVKNNFISFQIIYKIFSFINYCILIFVIYYFEIFPRISNLMQSTVLMNIDMIYEDELEKLERIYGEWINIRCGGWRSSTPCIVWHSDHITLELDYDDWKEHFSGLHEQSIYIYEKAYSDYGNDSDEMSEDEFDYAYSNDETIELFGELALIVGKNTWPGKDNGEISEKK